MDLLLKSWSVIHLGGGFINITQYLSFEWIRKKVYKELM